MAIETQVLRHLTLQASSLLSLLAEEMGILPDQSRILIELGAVYVNEERQRDLDFPIKVSDSIRVHAKPKRYPAEQIDWARRIIFQNEDFIVVNKPAGIPVHATLDNWWENVVHHVGLVVQTKLYTTHRLDLATSGLLVLAKNKKFLTEFNQLLRSGNLKKYYVAEVLSAEKPLKKGLLKHWMKPSERAPKEVSSEPQESWQSCELEVLDVTAAGKTQKVSIRLLTGRTHQIRAQLSAVGYPICGDVMYGGSPEPDGLIEAIKLTAARLEFQDFKFELDL